MSGRLPSDRELKIVCFSRTGVLLGERLCKALDFCRGELCAPARFGGDFTPLPADIRAWIGSRWGRCDFLFVGAAGIAVRMIAPFVKDKYTDSAVLSMDEKGRYVIPLLSGHVGGGVELAREIADFIGALPVITTATDVQGKFAVDVFARKHGLAISNRELAKRISADLLEGKQIGIWIDERCKGTKEALLQELRQWEELCICAKKEELRQYGRGIAVSPDIQEEEGALCLLPRNLVVGIGCKKKTPLSALEKGISEILAEHRLAWEQIGAIVSIDLKSEEPGLIELCRGRKIPFITYPAEELRKTGSVSGASEFVAQVTGVDNVCERAVKLYLQQKRSGTLIQEKRCLEGMTVAIGQWT